MSILNLTGFVLTCTLMLNSNMATAQETPAQAAHIASPDIYQLLLENDEVLVLKMVLQPGQGDNWHHHNAETVYFEQGGSAEIKVADDKILALDIPDGFVMWHGQWQHQVTNTGKTPITAIIVEQKSVEIALAKGKVK